VEPVVDPLKLKQILEAALLASDEPLSVERMARLFVHGELDSEEGRAQLRATLLALEADTVDRGYELVRVASGYRYQVRQSLAEWVGRLWEERPPRYSRALLETLALIAYRQPVTRGDIEDLRGVSVSPNIMRTLQERDWIRVVGEREAPGRPALYGTTRAFLDYFGLRALDQLPPLPEIRALLETTVEGGASAAASEPAASEPAVSEPAVSEHAVSEPAVSEHAMVDADPIGEDEDTSPGDTTSNAGPAEAGRAEGGTAGGAP
jgi:segregation and condensation protein B